MVKTSLFSTGIEEIKFLEALSDHEDTHPIVKIAGIDTWLRARSEILVVSEMGEIYITRKKNGLCADAAASGLIYDVPGGGWQDGEDHVVTAMREAQEEARLNCKNPMYVGAYAVVRPKAHPWVQEHVPEEYIWKGYYSEVFIATYYGNYTGDIADRDLDPGMASGEWVKIDQVIDQLCPVHQEAIKKYFKGGF